MADGTEKASGSSSSSATPTLVLDSLPFGSDDRDTLEMPSTEMDLLAQNLKDMPIGDKTTFVPDAPTVPCFCYSKNQILVIERHRADHFQGIGWMTLGPDLKKGICSK